MDTLDGAFGEQYGYVIACARERIKETDRDKLRTTESLQSPVITRLL